MQSLILSSKKFIYFFKSPSFVEAGIVIGFPHTTVHLENGNVIKNESHEFNLRFLFEANPSGIIGTFECIAILIIPSDTFLLGPLGPSGVIPIYFPSFKILKTVLREEDLLFDFIGILFNLK